MKDIKHFFVLLVIRKTKLPLKDLRFAGNKMASDPSDSSEKRHGPVKIVGGQVVNDDYAFYADVLIENGQIT